MNNVGLKRTGSVEDFGNSEFVYPAGEAPAQTLIDVVIRDWLMPELSFSDCIAMAHVCREWKSIIDPCLDDKFFSEFVFGKTQWEQVPGVTDVGVEPKLTLDQKARLIAKFKRVCPFFNKPDSVQPHRFQDEKIKRCWQTFRAILIPEVINGIPVNINLINHVFSFEKKVEDPRGRLFKHIIGDKKYDYRTKSSGRSYFLIVSLDVVPGSRNTDYPTKYSLVSSKGFRIPTPLEAVISTAVLNLKPKVGDDYFFGTNEGRMRDNSWTFRFCTFTATDTFLDDRYNVIFGAASR